MGKEKRKMKKKLLYMGGQSMQSSKYKVKKAKIIRKEKAENKK
jgi:hypothetical protein